MADESFIPREAITVSSNTRDAENLRPTSRQPWRSSPDDKKPKVTVELPEKTPIMEFELPENRNVRKVVVEFVTDKTTIIKVSETAM